MAGPVSRGHGRRPVRRRRRVVPVLAALILAAAAPAGSAQDRASAPLPSNAEILRDLQALQLALTIDIRRIDAGRVEAEGRLAGLEAEALALDAALQQAQAREQRVAAGLARIARTPSAAWLTAPGDLDTAVRRAVLARGLVDTLAQQQASIAADRERLVAVEAETRDMLAALAARETALRARIAELDRVTQARRRQIAALPPPLPQERIAQRQALGEAARSAGALIDNLAALELAELEARRRDDLATLSRDRTAFVAQATDPLGIGIPPERARLTGIGIRVLAEVPLTDGVMLPAAGAIRLGFGDTDPATGAGAQGVVIEAFEGAPVIAPLEGRVAYVGDLRGYGLSLILEHADGFHSVLGRLGRADVAMGQHVLAGEPIGAAVRPVSDGSTDAATAAIYFEMRRQGDPIDPFEGLSITQGRDRG